MSADRGRNRIAEWAARGARDRSDPVQAATVVLVRDGAQGVETLMLRRNSEIVFGGMWVFPGGRVDDADRAGLAGEDALAAARRAAVREAREEAGLSLDPAALVPFSHWTPPPVTPRRFLTWFFAARAPAGSVAIDHGEIHEHAWMRPRAALERHDREEIELAPPTWVTLHRLAGYADVGAALRDLGSASPERFSTRIASVEGGAVALWHGDAGYEDAAPERPGGRHRLWMLDSGWRYERR